MADTLDRTAPPDEAGHDHPVPHLFVGLECDAPLRGGVRCPLHECHRLTLTRADERDFGVVDGRGRRRATLAVADRWLSQPHAELRRTPGGWSIEDAGSNNGTFVNGRRIERSELLDDGAIIEAGHTLFLYREYRDVAGEYLEADGSQTSALETLSPALARQFADLERIVATELSVLIRGATGTGKELVARAIHERSKRAGDFIAVNCGAIPESLIESELFGHAKGAFTGATEASAGLIREADGGTLLLDEIGDLPASAQAALLRVLQEREVKPVGDTKTTRVDVRVLSASLRDFEVMIADGDFRQDLFARLATYELTLPRLSERLEDIGLLTAATLRTMPDGANARLRVSAGHALMAHHWRMNIRELDAALRRAVALARDGTIEPTHLALRSAATNGADAEEVTPPKLSPEDNAIREELVAALREHGGNITQVAKAMGKHRRQIQRWIKRFGVHP